MNPSDRIFLKFTKIVCKHADYSSIMIKSGPVNGDYQELKAWVLASKLVQIQ